MFNVSMIEARIVTSDEEYNGKPFTYQYVGLFINGVQINDSIDWWDIVYPSPKRISANFFPFTCSCGCAGCANWHYGYKLKFRKYTVEWSAIDHDEARNHRKPVFYSFARGQYESVQRRVLDLLEEIAVQRGTQGPFSEDFGPYDYDNMLRATNREDAIKEIDRTRAYRKEWFAKQDFSDYLLTRYGRCA